VIQPRTPRDGLRSLGLEDTLVNASLRANTPAKLSMLAKE